MDTLDLVLCTAEVGRDPLPGDMLAGGVDSLGCRNDWRVRLRLDDPGGLVGDGERAELLRKDLSGLHDPIARKSIIRTGRLIRMLAESDCSV